MYQRVIMLKANMGQGDFGRGVLVLKDRDLRVTGRGDLEWGGG